MTADYVIIGSGSAGAAIAYRLGEAGKKVVVIEQGGTDMGPFIQMPAALSYPMNMGIYDWGFQSEPEPYLGGRRLATPRGKVIGGSSSINGMVYVDNNELDRVETFNHASWIRQWSPRFSSDLGATFIKTTALESQLQEAGIRPSAAAGLGLGEYSALCAAGVFDPETAVALAAFRGQAMARAVTGRTFRMAAVLGLGREALQSAVKAAGDEGVVQIANYNCPDQMVIAGDARAVAEYGLA